MNLKEQALKKINPLVEKLSSQYDVALNFDYSEADLKSIMEYYDSKKNFISFLKESTDIDKYEYTKAFLIREAIRMYLREIAPKRIKRK